MILINELRITPDNKCLIIDTSIEDLFYYEGVTIDSILLDTSETFLITGPSEDAILLYNKDMQDLDIVKDDTYRHIRLEVTKPFIDLRINEMYFVYIIADISNAPNIMQASCNCSKNTILATVLNHKFIYDILLQSVNEISDNCHTPKNFIDKYLLLLALLTSISTSNYPLAIKFWKQFFSNINNTIPNKSCNCYG